MAQDITAIIEDWGHRIATAEGGRGLARLLPAFDDESFPLLRQIDPYDYTEFDASQVPAVIAELERLQPAMTRRPTPWLTS